MSEKAALGSLSLSVLLPSGSFQNHLEGISLYPREAQRAGCSLKQSFLKDLGCPSASCMSSWEEYLPVQWFFLSSDNLILPDPELTNQGIHPDTSPMIGFGGNQLDCASGISVLCDQHRKFSVISVRTKKVWYFWKEHT